MNKAEKFNNHLETLLTNRLEENHKKALEVEQFFNQLRNSFSTSKVQPLGLVFDEKQERQNLSKKQKVSLYNQMAKGLGWGFIKSV